MVSAMIAARVRGQMEPVGTIDVDAKGFTFETKDKKLSRLLASVRKKGVETRGGDGEVKGISVDRLERVKITEARIAPLTDLLLDRGYHWWEEE
jgi:hypothetical protein